jgi:hypothetical protein
MSQIHHRAHRRPLYTGIRPSPQIPKSRSEHGPRITSAGPPTSRPDARTLGPRTPSTSPFGSAGRDHNGPREGRPGAPTPSGRTRATSSKPGPSGRADIQSSRVRVRQARSWLARHVARLPLRDLLMRLQLAAPGSSRTIRPAPKLDGSEPRSLGLECWSCSRPLGVCRTGRARAHRVSWAWPSRRYAAARPEMWGDPRPSPVRR